MLTEKQQQIFDETFGMKQSRLNMYAAVEAVLAEQARAAEQGQASERTVKAKWPEAVALNSGAYKAWVILEHPSSNHVLSVRYPQSATAGTESAAWRDAAEILLVDMKQPTQPPAGDVVELVMSRGCPISCSNDLGHSYTCLREHVTAALAVAREGYVSLEDVVKMLQEAGFSGAANYLKFRLAKPAERVTVEKFDTPTTLPAIRVLLDGLPQRTFEIDERIHAERYAAGLREELKAGKHD